MLLSPSFHVIFFAALCLHLLLPSSISIVDSLVGGVNLVLGSVASSLNAWLLLDCWEFPLGFVGVWPLWFMSWTLTCQHGMSPEKYHSHWWLVLHNTHDCDDHGHLLANTACFYLFHICTRMHTLSYPHTHTHILAVLYHLVVSSENCVAYSTSIVWNVYIHS